RCGAREWSPGSGRIARPGGLPRSIVGYRDAVSCDGARAGSTTGPAGSLADIEAEWRGDFTSAEHRQLAVQGIWLKVVRPRYPASCDRLLARCDGEAAPRFGFRSTAHHAFQFAG